MKKSVHKFILILGIIVLVVSLGFNNHQAQEKSNQAQGIKPSDPPEISGGGAMARMQPNLPAAPAQTSPSQKYPFSGFGNPDAPPLLNSIEGFDFDDNGTETGFIFIPPDPIGAAGPNHVVAVVNVMIEWYLKDGTLPFRDALRDFFAPLTPTTFTFDPKVIYDQYADRFVVVTLEVVETGTNPDPGNISRILLAVSDDGDPNGTWHFHAIDAKTVIGGTVEHWADYPGFAIDEEAVYVTANMFAFSGASTVGGVRLWIVDKGIGSGGFYAGGAASLSFHDPYATSGGFDVTTQPAHIFGSGGVGTGVGTFLVGYSGLTDGVNEFVQVVQVDDPLGTPTFSAVQFIGMGDIENTSLSLPDAPQLGSGTEIEVNDRRALHAVWRNNALWTCFEILPASGPDAFQTTSHWVQMGTTTLSSLNLIDQGNVGGEDIATGTFTFFPSIAIDGSDNMAIGFSACASTIYAGAYYTGRLAGDPPGTVQPTGTLRTGLDSYQRTFGLPRNRWGDYSGMSVDPADDATFWIFNEYAITRGSGTPPEDGRWGTAWGRYTFQAQPPADKLLVSEFVVTPTAGEFIEIYNPNSTIVDLSDYYLTDATLASGNTYYYQIVEGGGGGGASTFDWHARFPDGATIAPGEYQTMALAGDSLFFEEYGVLPTYEMYEDGTNFLNDVPDMREATPGSINNQGTLTNGDEVIILYHWDSLSDLVGDVDYVIYDDAGAVPNEAVDKTGVSIDGPDPGTDSTAYLNDTAIFSQVPAVSPGFGFSTHRIDFNEGAQATSGGNGVTGADETSEDLDNTFTDNSIPSPNAAFTAPPAGNFVANLNGGQPVPIVLTSGNGTGFFTLNGDSTELTYDIAVQRLTGTITASHFHNAPAGSNGSVVKTITFVGDTSSGVWTSSDPEPLTPTLVNELFAGNLYINVHTSYKPAGEIRGQVLASATPNDPPFEVNLLTPPDGARLLTSPASTDSFLVSWSFATDPDGDTVEYLFQLDTSLTFSIEFVDTLGTDTSFSVTFAELDTLLSDLLVAPGDSLLLYWRVFSSDPIGNLTASADTFSFWGVREVGPVGLNSPRDLQAAAGDGVIDLSWLAPLPFGELGYDDGTSETGFGFTGTGEFAVRFSPLVYPSKLLAIKTYWANIANPLDNVEYSVWLNPDSGDFPPTLQFGSNTFFTVSVRGQFSEVDISAQNISINQGSFFYSWIQPDTINYGIGLDQNSPDADRAWLSFDGGATWAKLNGLGFPDNLMIRALVQEGTGPHARIVEIAPDVIEPLELSQIKRLRGKFGHLFEFRAQESGVLGDVRANTLEYSGIEALQGYELWRSEDSLTFNSIATTDTNTLVYSDNTVMNDSTYWYYATAVYDEGVSDPSNVASATPASGVEPLLNLVHTPGDLNVAIYNDGSIGADQASTSGPGVTWKGQNGIYVGGPIFGTASLASLNGYQGSFGIGADIQRVSSNYAAGFTTDPNFDQVTNAVFSDANAPVPYGVNIIQKSYSNTTEEFVFIRYGYVNNSGSTLADFYGGIFIDWDIDASTFTSNSGGYIPERNLVYQFDTGTSPYYYGMAALDGWSGARTTTQGAGATIRTESYTFITTFVPTIDPPGDFRSWLGTGPVTIAAGDTAWVTFAIVAGDDEAGIDANAIAAALKAQSLGWTTIVGIAGETGLIPTEYALHQNFPNPFNPTTTIKYDLKQTSDVSLKIFNLLGQEVRGLVNTTEEAGYKSVNWDGLNNSGNRVASGIYIYRIQAGDFVQARKMILMK